MGVAAVKELLYQAMGIHGGGATHTSGAAVEAQTATDQVDGRWAEEAADGVGAAVDRGAGAGGQEAKAQLAQERDAPLVVGETRTRFALGQFLRGGAELCPVTAQTVPRLGDGLIDALVLG